MTVEPFTPLGEAAWGVLKRIPRPPYPTDAPKVHPGLGEPSARYVYTDGQGAPLALVMRFDKSDKTDKTPAKEFRPYDLAANAWRAPEVRPLYRLDALSAHGGPVVLVEGEKCADALNDLGILATTAFGGSNGVGKTDFSPLKGRDVVIWPDADGPGEKYATAAADTLRNGGARSVRVAPIRNVEGGGAVPRYVPRGAVCTNGNDAQALSYSYTDRTGATPDALSYSYRNDGQGAGADVLSYSLALAKGWDAADAVEVGWTADDLLAFLGDAEPTPSNDNAEPSPAARDILGQEGDADQAEDWPEPDMSILNPTPKPPTVPLDVFGSFWGEWIAAKAEGASAPPDYVAASVLAATSALIGNARVVQPWEGWREPAFLWIALVGNPSSGKSPAMDPVMRLLRQIELDKAPDHDEALRRHEADVMAAQCLRQEWEKEVKEAVKQKHPPPIKPEGATEPPKPTRPRIRVSDATPEALARLIADQPKGVLVQRDELAGWLGSFNRYAGGDGGDRPFWLEAFGGRPYIIDRARNGGESVTIPHLGASIIGGIQPDKFQSKVLGGDDDGLAARFLYLWPEPLLPRRPQRTLPDDDALTAFRWLDGLTMPVSEDGTRHPGIVLMEEPAIDAFDAWRRDHAAAQPEGMLASWWGKMPGLVLRLALALEYLNAAHDTRQEPGLLSLLSLLSAVKLVEDYFKPMARRAFGDASLPKAQRDAATLAKWILKERPEVVNARDLQRQSVLSGAKTAESIKAPLNHLEKAGWIAPERRSGPGRPSKVYVVNPLIIPRLA